MGDSKKNDDILKSLFQRLPEEELPHSFRERIMQKILMEAVEAKKRNERMTLLALILASLGIIALAVLSILYLGFPEISISVPDLSVLPFYFYIGILVLILLSVDLLFRKKYFKKHEKDML